jgi:formamidopyrimidine-DNA glycosylase
MGKTLLLSVRTNKTLRVHDGIAGTFAYQEQMCALENLRIWKDQDSNGVLAMIHYTPQFRDGYMRFYCEF